MSSNNNDIGTIFGIVLSAAAMAATVISLTDEEAMRQRAKEREKLRKERERREAREAKQRLKDARLAQRAARSSISDSGGGIFDLLDLMQTGRCDSYVDKIMSCSDDARRLRLYRAYKRDGVKFTSVDIFNINESMNSRYSRLSQISESLR